MELHKLQDRIKELEQHNEDLKNSVTYKRILDLEHENRDLRSRLDSVYEFIHHTGNEDYFKNQEDWDGVTTESTTTGNSERLDRLTRQFGIDEYPLE